MNILIRITLFTFLASILIACKTKTVYVPVEKTKTEIEFIDRMKKDSIYIQDSVFLAIKGDTIYKEKYKTVYKEIIRIDSVRHDSIVYSEVPVPVDVPTPYYPKWMIILAVIGGVGIGYATYKLTKLLL